MPTEETGLPTDVDELHKMVGELRKEAADYRTKYKPFRDSFDGFTDQEVSFLLNIVDVTSKDADAGAPAFRDLALDLLGEEKFKDGLAIAPTEEDNQEEEAPVADEEKPASVLTKEELIALFEERDQAAAKTREEEEREAEIEEVYAEVEALGFERGTEGFLRMLMEGQVKAQLGEDVDFEAIAPGVRSAVGMEDSEDGEAEAEAEAPAEEDGTKFPKSADATKGKGAPTEEAKDWVAEAVAEGRNPLDVARERMEARLDGETV